MLAESKVKKIQALPGVSFVRIRFSTQTFLVSFEEFQNYKYI